MAKFNANPAVDAVVAQVTATNTVIDSAVTLINGIAQMIKDAVAAAIAGGATAADLAPLTDLVTSLNAKTAALSAAVVANTPAAPVVPPTPQKKP